ncbi:amino acid/polyamine transporter I, partial [Aspergillus californicus]
MTVLSLAELASVWPHPGGPLFWITKVSPHYLGPVASFFMGWMNFLAYIASIGSAGFSSTQTVTALITNLYGYEWDRWQMCLVYWGFALSFVPISLRASWLPAWSVAALVCLILTLLVTVGIWLSHMEPQSPKFVFTHFVNNTGWASSGFVFVLSLVQTTFAMSGLEAATHMSFETKEPQRTIPLVLVCSVAASTILCFGFAILLLFALGPLESLSNSSLGAIYLQLYVNSIGKASGLAVATIIMLLLNQFCGVQLLSASSRVIWALSRAQWVPFSSIFARVNPITGVPVPATFFSVTVSMLLGLLYVASDTAWNAIASCVVGAFQLTYIAPLLIQLLFHGRSRLPSGRYFNLDVPFLPGLGYVINALAVLWGLCIFVISLFPVYLPVTASGMNYSVVVFGLWAFLLIPYWLFIARYQRSSERLDQDLTAL